MSASLSGKQVTEFANKIFVYNLGCEMVYLISHRLQKVMDRPDKIISALKDITRTLYSDEIANLIDNSDSMLTIDGIRNILYNICHSSVIVLDPKNFLKLYQMIVMT
jgi:Organic solute transport protein 1